MKLGIGSYTFTWAVGIPGRLPARRLTAEDLLDEAVRLGVEVVQICDNLPFLQRTDSEIEAFAQKSQALGLTIEWGTRGLDPDILKRNLELCRRFHCPFLRLVIDSPGDEPTAEEAVARLEAILPEFETANVMLAIENHDRFPAAVLASMVEKLGPQRVGITLDTVNSFGALEPPETVVAALGRYTVCLHVKDFTVQRPSHQLGFTVEGCAAGSGQLNVPWLLQALAVSPHPFNVILETWVTPSDSLDETIARERRWADEGVAYLKTLIPD